MLNWFFKKRAKPVAAPVPVARQARGETGETGANGVTGATGAARPARPDAVAAPEWSAQLQAAQGDDAALLRLAASVPVLAVKMAAVAALASETALRQAEREFRSHDRRVHRLARQRLDAAVAGREARATAGAVLERVQALIGETELAMNFVVQVDRDWQALPADLLEPDQRSRFTALRSRLDAVIRERDEAQQQRRRWTAEAGRRLPEWQHALATAAEHGGAGAVAGLMRSVQALRSERPPDAAAEGLALALAQLEQTAAGVERRLAWFDAQPAAGAASAAVEVAPQPPVEAPADDAPPAWADLPPVPDAALARTLDQRHAQWLRARAPARPVVAAEPVAMAALPPRPGRHDGAQALQRLESLLQQAEQALEAGQVGAMQQHLKAIDALPGATHAPLPGALHARHQALLREGARLKGWQQWGGARAREDLVAEAEALARQTPAAADAAAGNGPKPDPTLHARAVQSLRQRWKELDRQGATAAQPLWQRFDAALQVAFAPVAAQQAALKAARQENLAAREALLHHLDALPLPPAAAAPDDLPHAEPVAEPPPAWKDLARELDGFHLAWRKLGPVAHTVPAGARDALLQRLRHSVDRIEAPLQARRQAATAEREQLIARAAALAPGAGQTPSWPDAARQVRDLQAAWQHQARQLPLPRALEAGLWIRFKAATDAVFAERDAAMAVRDAELAANLAAREALLERLSALGAATPPAEIERTLAEVDRDWHRAVALPRGAGETLDPRFRAARAIASQRVGAAQTRHWQARCDALADRLAWCEAREAAADATADPEPIRATPDDMPGAWQQALDWRRARPVVPGPLEAAVVDGLLLQLEAALDLPVAPERQADRRQLKLRALKDAMEGRGVGAQDPARHAEAWLALLRQAGLSAAQRQRLQALVAALRQAPPGTLVPVSVPARSAAS